MAKKKRKKPVAQNSKEDTKLLEDLTSEIQNYGRFSLAAVDMGRHDVVNLGDVQAEAVVQIYMNEESMRIYSDEIVALDDFVLTCNFCLGQRKGPISIYYRRYRPGALSLNRQGAPCAPADAVIRGLYEAFYLDPYTHEVRGSMQTVYYNIDGELALGTSLVEIDSDWMTYMSLERSNGIERINMQVMALFAFVQNQMAECPTAFIATNKGKLPKTNPDSQSIYADRAKRSKVSVVRRVYAYQDDLDNEEGTTRAGHKVTCEFYTVRGHWRKYKSGKVVWINSYAKGTDRLNPDRIKAKDYIIEGGDKTSH